MNPDLQSVLADIASKLGTTADRVFPMLVAKARLEALVLIGVGTVLSIGLAYASVRFFRYSRSVDSDFYPAGFVCGVLALACSLFIWCNIGDAAYPQAAAIQQIIHSVNR